ncbi:MAG: HAMP domain-containing sensor histidine kinase [Lachnospiraceae bacterium]|nr:HAMP domain-containing sensor histidine kinase [Lachnospiraceae bacterium]
MRHSIRFKLTAILIVTILSIVAVAAFVNFTFAESFYYQSEQDNIVETYQKVNELFNNVDSNTADSDTENELWQITQKSNIRMVIAQPSDSFYGVEILYNTTYESGKIFTTMTKYLQEIQNYTVFGGDDNTKEIVEKLETTGYVINDSRNHFVGQKDITLFGLMDNGYLVAMQIPLESMQNTVRVFSKFLTIIGALAIMFGILIMNIVSRSFTRPIKEMAGVAEKMRELDFDARVTKITPDELGDLGICINDLSSKLEQTISELKTANNELRKDIDKKVEIDDMRKEFISHVSHELKTPIALIQGYAEGLKENISDDEESREFYCEVISDEAHKMNKMVKKLLTLNEIEFGQDKVHIERFDVTDLLNNLVSSVKILAEKKNVNVIFHRQEPLYVWADEFMIEEVLSNYISNALNHVTDNGQIHIYFKQKEKDVRICIYNTGEHIPEEDINKIWIKFFKVDKARTREYGGSGIGLSIVAATMEAHGKQYGVNNVEGGVEFYIDLDTTL